IVLFLAAWLGHAFLWTVLLNVVFSRPYHRRLLGAFRLFVAVVVLVVPPVLLLAYGAPPVSWLEETVRLRPPGPFAAYVALCWLIGVVILPILTIRRKLRRPPPVVAERRGQVFDVAERLGEPPVGDGKLWRLAFLPGTNCSRASSSGWTCGSRRLRRPLAASRFCPSPTCPSPVRRAGRSF